jgi:DNA-binding MarR family transcriptional regulator
MNVTAQQLCDELNRLVDAFKVFLVRASEGHGLTKVQLFVLHSIHQQGSVAMGQMAGFLHCDASNVTGIVDRLVQQGLIVRRESTTDRRTKQLELTPKGQSIITEVEAIMPAALGIQRLSDEERGQLFDLVHKMIGDEPPVCPMQDSKSL